MGEAAHGAAGGGGHVDNPNEDVGLDDDCPRGLMTTMGIRRYLTNFVAARFAECAIQLLALGGVVGNPIVARRA